MRIFTTPTLNIHIRKKDGSPATDLEFEYLIFTIKSLDGKTRLDKRMESSEVSEGSFVIELTQEETGMFEADETLRAEINFFNADKRLATLIKATSMDDNLIDEVV